MANNRVVTLEAQGHLLRLRIPGEPLAAERGGGRGLVTEFSAQSRKRMLELMARIDAGRAGFMAFVTFTYPDREGPPEPGATERDRQTLQKRFGRAYPDASALWRREHEKRKSGAFKGVLFPHYHYLFFGLPFVHHGEINRMWREVIGYEGYVRTEIEGVRSWGQAFAYVAKYMAKEPDGAGAGGRAGIKPGPAGERGSLVYVTYLTGEDQKAEPESPEDPPPRKSIGRSWGVFNRKALPFAERKRVRLPDGEWVKKARQGAGRHWEGVWEWPHTGFTLFLENAEQWLDEFVALQELLEDGVIPEGGLEFLAKYGVLPEGFRPEQRN